MHTARKGPVAYLPSRKNKRKPQVDLEDRRRDLCPKPWLSSEANTKFFLCEGATMKQCLQGALKQKGLGWSGGSGLSELN